MNRLARQGLAPGLAQRPSLAPGLAQSLRLMVLPGVELTRVVETALETNIMLEREEPAASDAESCAPLPATDWGEWPGGATSRPDELQSGEFQSSEEGLRSHLFAQLALEHFPARDRAIAEAIIDALDEDGYLRTPAPALVDSLPDLAPPVSAAELEMVIHRIQRLDPTGVAARDCTECLLVQLGEFPADTPGLDCAKKLVRDHLPALARHETNALARRIRATASQVQTARALIRGLDPHPGFRYTNTRIEYLNPELLARRGADGWQVEPNPAVSPRLRVNATYTDWLAAHRGRSDCEALSAQLQEARLLVANLAQREQTLLRVGTTLVRRQAAFLDAGPAALVPLTLNTVAGELGLHESTVSRAVQGKSMATPRGTIPLRHFFSGTLSKLTTGEGLAARAVQARVEALIAGENPATPLSDAALAAALKADGVAVARRTITKYREALGLASTRERRRPAKP